jgi:hypothetical protein
MSRHPNKHIQAAVKHAQSLGWTLTLSRGHAWRILRCPFGHRQCQISVWSTPRVPENHAKDIRRRVDRCPGG